MQYAKNWLNSGTLTRNSDRLQSDKGPTLTEMDRALELTKIKAYDHWKDSKLATKEQITAKTILKRVTTKMAQTKYIFDVSSYGADLVPNHH